MDSTPLGAQRAAADLHLGTPGLRCKGLQEAGLRLCSLASADGTPQTELLGCTVGPVLAVVTGCARDLEVMETAASIAGRHKADAIALLVAEVPRSRPLENGARAPVEPERWARLGEVAERLGLPLVVTWGRERLQTLLEEARRRHAVALVTVAWCDPHLPGRLHDDSLALLTQAPCTVWLVRQGPRDTVGLRPNETAGGQQGAR